MQQLLLIEALASNWPEIRRLLGEGDPAMEAALAKIMERFLHADSHGKRRSALVALQMLAEDTAAEDFLRDLVNRNDLTDIHADKERTVGAPAVLENMVSEMLAQQETISAWSLAQAIKEPTVLATVPVYFATSRQMEEAGTVGDTRVNFTTKHGEALELGRVTVDIPVAHKKGKVEKPRWWKWWNKDGTEGKHLVAQPIELFSRDDFHSELSNDVDIEANRDVLVFLHGYNVSFKDAVLRAAQVAHDLDFAGTIVLFSWPSAGKARKYPADEANAGASGEYLADFLKLLADGPWRHVHVLAHSMGNRVMLSALADNPGIQTRIGQVIFAAADVHTSTFRSKFPKMQEIGLHKTSYVSEVDRALWVSQLIHAAPRIGMPWKNEVFCMDGLQSIDATAVSSGFLTIGLNHSYVGDKRAMLTDLSNLLSDGLAAAERKPLRHASNKKYWLFPY